jgi:uncharacterized protein YpmS
VSGSREIIWNPLTLEDKGLTFPQNFRNHSPKTQQETSVLRNNNTNVSYARQFAVGNIAIPMSATLRQFAVGNITIPMSAILRQFVVGNMAIPMSAILRQFAVCNITIPTSAILRQFAVGNKLPSIKMYFYFQDIYNIVNYSTCSLCTHIFLQINHMEITKFLVHSDSFINSHT